MLGLRAQARARQRRAWSTSRRPLATEDTRESGRGRACAATGGVRARGRRRAPDNPRRVGACAGSARRPPPGDAGPVRTCATPHLLPLHHPQKSRTRWAARGTFVDLELSVARPPGILRSLPTPQAPGTAPIRLGNWGWDAKPRAPLPVPGFKEPQAARRPGGLAKRRGGPGGGGGRGGRSGVEGPGVGGGGGEAGVGAEGRGFERRGGGSRGGEGRSRAARAASEPESWSCRSPATPACALRSGREPPGRAGRRGSPKSGHEPGEKVRSRGHHLSPSGAGVRRNAEDQRRQAAGRPSAPGEQAARRPSGRERQRRRPEPCPRPPAPGGAPGGGGGARRGARAAAQTLYKGASPARRRRGAARTPPKFAACARGRAAAAAGAAPGPPGRHRAPERAEPAM